MTYRRAGSGTYANQDDTRPATTAHAGLMPKLGAATATLGGFVVTGGGGPGSTINADAATASVAGAMSAADYNSLQLLADPPRARAFTTANKSIASGTFANPSAVTWDNASPNSAGASGGTAPIATSKFTCPAGGAGFYAFDGYVVMASSVAGTVRGALLRVNGTGATIARTLVSPVAGGNSTDMVVSGGIQLAAGDYVELVPFQDTGGALNCTLAVLVGVRRCA